MAARSLNKVTIMGNLTRDPELRYTPKGTAVCTFGMATNRSWTPTDGGERQEETEFHRIVSWSKLAEICSQLLYKGRRVYLEGRLQTRTWQGQDGQDRTTTEVVIDNMIALGAPKNAGDRGTYAPQSESTGSVPAGGQATVKDVTGKPAPKEEVIDINADIDKGKDEPAEEPKSSKAKGAGKKTAAKDKQAEDDVADDIPF